MKGKIFNIQNFSIQDGPGIRTTVFFLGCNLRCVWCHNPESWEFSPKPAFLAERCIGCGVCFALCPAHKKQEGGKAGIDYTLCSRCGRCARECFAGALTMHGREMEAEELWGLIAQEKLYFVNGGGGVTFSGGECMLQVDFLAEIVALCRANGVHTAVDTAGHVPFQWLARVSPDLFLYDIKAASPELSTKLTGVDGALIWENLGRLLSEGLNVHVRVPCVPGANWHELPEIAARLSALGAPEPELLAYHKLGEGKAEWFGQEKKVFEVPAEELMEEARRMFGMRDN
ncbi:MAG: glycyl-radical enzyme activating protein [Clostridiales bacterium]|jgi:pyruvate formate lyase activating enzyme|nr:glycyl-radical enzyme activating protein [Clostridiales bacterium]